VALATDFWNTRVPHTHTHKDVNLSERGQLTATAWLKISDS